MDLSMFNPSQPELKLNCDYYIEHKPVMTLQSQVSLYYQFKTNKSSLGFLPIIPDGCLELLFSCNPSYPSANVATSPKQRCSYSFKPNSEYFAVRLSPLQSSIVFQCSIKEILQHQQLSLSDILTIDQPLIEEIVTLQSFKERITRFNSLLYSKRRSYNDCQKIVNHCLFKIYNSNGLLNLKELSTETGYSDRYIRKKFDEYIGFSPKQFSQIVRLQDSVHSLINKRSNLNDVIDDNYFYDKAHFYKDFKNYMNLTPKQYFYKATL